MKKSVIATLFFLISLMAASCNKSIFSNGTPVTESRDIGYFRAISMYNNVNVKLVRSSQPHLELTCPENLIDKIITEVPETGDTLVIKNNNKLNWLRSTDYSIDLTVYYDSLREINYASIGDLNCIDPLIGTRHLFWDTVVNGIDTTFTLDTINRAMFLNINEGSGDINLTLDCDVFKHKFGNGTSTVTFKGAAGYSEIITRSYGKIDALELYSNFSQVQSKSTNNVYVWAQTGLTVELYSIGNIYYKGTPQITVDACTSDGRLIPIN